jgi:hypothetical protein
MTGRRKPGPSDTLTAVPRPEAKESPVADKGTSKAAEQRAAEQQAAPVQRPRQITVALAHSLSAKWAVHSGLEDRDYGIGETITIPRNRAQSLINAGYIKGVEPSEEDQVAEVLGVDERHVVDNAAPGAGTSAAAATLAANSPTGIAQP